MLNPVDEEFDQMALLVEMAIVRDCARTAGVGRDHGGNVALCQVGAKPIRVEGFIAKHILARQTGNQRFGLGRLVRLSSGVEQTQYVSQRIDCDVDFRAQAAARPPDGLFLNPPFPPAAC